MGRGIRSTTVRCRAHAWAWAPARTFSLTAEGRAHFPADYDGLAAAALEFVEQLGGPTPWWPSPSHVPLPLNSNCASISVMSGKVLATSTRRRPSRLH